jgi:hypothetical protein
MELCVRSVGLFGTHWGHEIGPNESLSAGPTPVWSDLIVTG